MRPLMPFPHNRAESAIVMEDSDYGWWELSPTTTHFRDQALIQIFTLAKLASIAAACKGIPWKGRRDGEGMYYYAVLRVAY